MSVNRHKQHLLVLPEDDANRQLANGFLLHPSLSPQIQVLEVAGGWLKVLDRFEADHVGKMNAYPDRFMVLLIDFDGHQDRLDRAKASIPDNLKDRVFVLGVWTEPEALKAILGSYEGIGLAMAKDCLEETATTWGHELLRHNAGEMERLRQQVRPILFQ
ncbi:MAG: hypothetical protein NTW28_30710 [Candidatus Solibacter sp.]|nr:hypothetical protein [Candidatus Solibacter sp.]